MHITLLNFSSAVYLLSSLYEVLLLKKFKRSLLQVQGVFFRNYTEAAAQRMGIVGWVMNTKHGTVAGEAQGRPLALQQFKGFLHEGSPMSKVEKVVITDESELSVLTFSLFERRR
eukprot:jgi/Botrbrau1/19252/Bobra.0073s0005.1